MDGQPFTVFISHTHDDEALAHALRGLVKSSFADRIRLVYSSDFTDGGGVQVGENWLHWIANAVKTSDLTFVILTPRSVQKPWILWESGAVTGVALANNALSRLVPILYRMGPEGMPEPMRTIQAVLGEQPKSIHRLLQRLNAETTQYPAGVLEAVAEKNEKPYLQAVAEALLEQPLLLDEAQVGEWVNRLDRLRAEKRSAEVGHLHRALQLATAGVAGRGLLDLRIHRRLGEMYLEAKDGKRAIEEIEHAVLLAPRDIYLLHQLGLAYLEQKDTDEASRVLKHIEKLDPDISKTNPEIAGFKGRLYRELWTKIKDPRLLRTARDAYADALAVKTNSYYLADNVAQLSLTLGEKQHAIDTFRRAREIIEGSGERSVWSLASLATAYIACGDDPAAVLKAIWEMKPAAREQESIGGGLQRVQEGLGLERSSLDTWIRTLTTGAT